MAYRQVIIDGITCKVEVINNRWYLREYDGKTEKYIYPFNFEKYRIQLGANITCEVVNRNSNQGTYNNPMITNLTGYGDMYNFQQGIYESINPAGEFILRAVYENSQWINVTEVTLTLDGENPPSTSRYQIIYLISDIARYTNYFCDARGMWSGISSQEDVDPFDLVIPDGITSICKFNGVGNGGYWSINNLTLGSGLKYIYGDCFQGAIVGMQTLVIPENVELIGYSAFSSCNSITTIDFSRNTKLTYESFEAGKETPSFSPADMINYAFAAYYYESDQRVGLPTTVILGDESLRDLPWFRYDTYNEIWWGRDVTFEYAPTPAHVGEYRCYDSVNGEQVFRLYDSPQEGYNRVYGVEINGQMTNLYLPMTDINDTTNGGNRVQYIEGVGSMRFKY